MESTAIETLDLATESESTLSLPIDGVPPAVIDVEDEETQSAMQIPENIQDPKIKYQHLVEVIPLRMVLVPYGRKEPIPFDEKELARLRDKYVGEHEVEIPQWLKSLDKEGDWRASIFHRINGRKDWTYEHRVYCKKFRSKLDVERFLNSDGITFQGRKLQKKKIAGLDGQCTGTLKYTRGRKASISPREKTSVDASHSVEADMSPGFL